MIVALPPEWHIPALIALIAVVLILLLSNRVRSDWVALSVPVVLTFTGLIAPDAAFAGLSSSTIMTLIGLFIISRALEVTGVVAWAAERLERLAGVGAGAETRLIALCMGAGAVLSLIMNNVAAAAVLLPAVVQVGARAGVRPSRLLMPMSFGVLVGGMATYFTTPNIVLSDLLTAQGVPPLTMGDFLRIGGPIAGVSIAVMLAAARRLLPDRASPAAQMAARNPSQALYEEYELEDRMWELRILPSSRLADTALSESGIGRVLGLTVLAIWRGHEALLNPAPGERLRAGDYLLILGREDRVTQLHGWGLVLGREPHRDLYRPGQTVDLTEVVIPPRSGVVGKTLTELRFRGRYGLTSVALWRGGRSYRTDVGRMPLGVGDALLMVGDRAAITRLAADDDYLVVRDPTAAELPATRPRYAGRALCITALALGVSIAGAAPTAHLMLAGALALVMARCLTMDEAYRSIEWRVVFLIAGMLPLSIAMAETGLAAALADGLVATLAPLGALALLGGMFALTTAITQGMSAQVSAIVLGPVALSAASAAGIPPTAMAITVAIACSTAFLTPIAHPVNLLVMGPGGYQPGDFARVGLVFTVITAVLTLGGVALAYGVR